MTCGCSCGGSLLSRRVSSVAPSATLAIAAKAKELQSKGIDVVSLSAGEPDFDTPEFIKEACAESLRQGNTKYTPAQGTLEIRKAIARKLERDQKLQFSPDQIILSCGAKHAIFNTLFSLLDDGDEVLIPSPFWLSYPEMVGVLGGKSVFLPTDESTGFKIRPQSLERAITDRSKVLILNSPSNPTGAVYTREELLALAEVLRRHPRVVVLSDEIYEKLVFDGLEYCSIATLDSQIASRTVIVNGHSKAYAMTGWRLGYSACSNKELAQAISSVQSHSTSNPTSFAQAGGVAALDRGEEDAIRMRDIYQKRRDLFVGLIAAVPGLKPFKPQGAFYLFVNIEGTGKDSMALTQGLLEKAHVAVVPGKPFGSDKHIRLSFASSEAHLEKAAARLREWLPKL